MNKYQNKTYLILKPIWVYVHLEKTLKQLFI